MSKPSNARKDHARFDLLWGTAKPGARGPKPSRTLDELVDAAIAIADREGLSGVSMQRVAAELRFTKMAVYRYVSSQAELLVLMIDRALGPAPYLAPSSTWRGSLEVWAGAIYYAFSRHPWTLQAMAGPRPIGPNEAAWMERALESLASTGLDGADKLDVLAVLSGHLRFVAQQSIGTAADGRAEHDHLVLIRRTLPAESFPELTRAIDDSRQARRTDAALNFGLSCILDGIELRMARHRAR